MREKQEATKKKSIIMYFQGEFKYAICIDLVTTCWDHRNFSQADAIERQEIIGKFKPIISSVHVEKQIQFVFSLPYFFPPEIMFNFFLYELPLPFINCFLKCFSSN